MPKLPRYLTLFFLIIFLLQMLSLLVMVLTVDPAQAADKIYFKPNVDFGLFTKSANGGQGVEINGNTIGNYVLTIYKFAVNIVGILATVIMMFGGFLWITAGGNASKVDNAKSWIAAAATGLVLTLASYTLLNTVNPDLVKFSSINLPKPDLSAIGCCEPEGQDGAAYNSQYSECQGGSFNVGYTAKSGECVKNDVRGCCLITTNGTEWHGCNNNIFETDCTKKIENNINLIHNYNTKFEADKTCEESSYNEWTCE